MRSIIGKSIHYNLNDLKKLCINFLHEPTDFVAKKIQRANLDGSNIEDLVQGVGRPGGIALDVVGGKMYWTVNPSKIQRANLDGSNIEDLVTRTQGVDYPFRIALDIAGGKMYWADPYEIQRANLDGSNIEDLVTYIQGVARPAGIALLIRSKGSLCRYRRALIAKGSFSHQDIDCTLESKNNQKEFLKRSW